MKKLNIMATIKDGIALGMINFLSLLLTTILYFLTIWIPYLNVGTTIAFSSLAAELAKGKVINPLFIFDAKYRKNMGEFFILFALMSGGISAGFAFGIIPGIVIAIAWDLAIVLFVDKELSALDALRESNRLTYGNKWRIFGITFLFGLAVIVAIAIINVIFGIGEVHWLEAIGDIIIVAIALCVVPVACGIDASIYKQLSSGEILGEEPAAPAPAAAPAPEAPKAEAPKAVEPKAEAPKAKAPKAE